MKAAKSFILTYHSLDTSGSVISLHPETFRRQMRWLSENSIQVRPLAEVASVPGSVALTFDDGFRNFHEHALPELMRFRYPATVFCVSGHTGGRNNWPSQPANPEVPMLELMNWDELGQVARAGISLGAHTRTHASLGRLPESEVEQEMRSSQAEIEDRTGAAVKAFAYPYGDASAPVKRIAARYFQFGCGTRLDYVSPHSDRIDLPRIDAYYLRDLRYFRALQKSSGVAYIGFRRSLRAMRRGWVTQLASQ